MELLDTPGILWPKFEDPKVGECIAFLGSISEMITIPEELATELIRTLKERNSCSGLEERFGLEGELTPSGILDCIAVKRGCLGPGGEPNTEKAAGILMNEFRAGLLGRITLEDVPE